MNIVVSACLLGENCKYDGGSNCNETVLRFVAGHRAVPVCPEVAGGLPTPRTPSEIVDGVVTSRNGESVDAQFRKGARICLQQALEPRADLAILQPRSPSCGARQIYDGTFCGQLVDGSGVFAALLAEHGIPIVEPDDL